MPVSQLGLQRQKLRLRWVLTRALLLLTCQHEELLYQHQQPQTLSLLLSCLKTHNGCQLN